MKDLSALLGIHAYYTSSDEPFHPQKGFLLDGHIKECAWAQQTHGTQVLFAERSGMLGEADGLMTTIPGLYLASSYADCLPLYFWDPQVSVLALVHSGWKGSLAGIARQTLELMIKNYGVQAQKVRVLFGPSNRSCCYAVGDDFYETFSQNYGKDLLGPSFSYRSGTWYWDNETFNRSLLEHLGVRTFFSTSLCTYEATDLFSHRRGDVGRNWALACLP